LPRLFDFAKRNDSSHAHANTYTLCKQHNDTNTNQEANQYTIGYTYRHVLRGCNIDTFPHTNINAQQDTNRYAVFHINRQTHCFRNVNTLTHAHNRAKQEQDTDR
jgi:hypothetical protein